MILICDTCGGDWPTVDYLGYCVCGGGTATDTSPVRRVETSEVCENCRRRGKDPEYGGYCECGVHAWWTDLPKGRVETSLVCDICRRHGKNPDLGGLCECGANAWLASPQYRVERSQVCQVCNRKGKDPRFGGHCECGANAWNYFMPAPRMETSLMCDNCKRVGKNMFYQGGCECGNDSWIDTAPVPRLETSLVCARCGRRGKNPAYCGLCECGSNAWKDSRPAPRVQSPQQAPPRAPAPPHDPAKGTVLDGNDVPPMIIDDYAGAQINELLGGIYRGALVLVVGAAGAGKSTYSAELAAIAATHLDSKIYWLDRDQKHPDLVRACFATLGAEGSFHRVKLVQPPKRMPDDWGILDALSLVPSDVAVLVIDSLETWGSNDTIRLAVMDRVKQHPARLKLVIAGTNAEGSVSGMGALERADDATVFVEIQEGKHTIRCGKRRWPPCQSALARAALRASAESAGDPAEESPADIRAYPSRPAARQVMKPHAKCSSAM